MNVQYNLTGIVRINGQSVLDQYALGYDFSGVQNGRSATDMIHEAVVGIPADLLQGAVIAMNHRSRVPDLLSVRPHEIRHWWPALDAVEQSVGLHNTDLRLLYGELKALQEPGVQARLRELERLAPAFNIPEGRYGAYLSEGMFALEAACRNWFLMKAGLEIAAKLASCGDPFVRDEVAVALLDLGMDADTATEVLVNVGWDDVGEIVAGAERFIARASAKPHGGELGREGAETGEPVVWARQEAVA